MPVVQHGQLCCPSSILKPSQHAESLEVHYLRTVSFAIEVCTFSQRCLFWSLAEKIGGGIVFWLLWCFFSCCPRCSMSIHFATTGKSDKRRRNNMCGWNTMFGSNIFQVRSSDIEHMCCAMCCAAGASWGFDVDHRTWSKDPTRSMHPIRSSGRKPTGLLKKPTVSEHANNMQTTHSRHLNIFEQHTLQDCSFNSPCFRWQKNQESQLTAWNKHTQLYWQKDSTFCIFLHSSSPSGELLWEHHRHRETKEPNSDIPEPDTCGNWGTAKWNKLLPVRSEHIYTSLLIQSMCPLFYKRTLTIRCVNKWELFDFVWPVHNHSPDQYDGTISVTQHTSKIDLY